MESACQKYDKNYLFGEKYMVKKNRPSQLGGGKRANLKAKGREFIQMQVETQVLTEMEISV